MRYRDIWYTFFGKQFRIDSGAWELVAKSRLNAHLLLFLFCYEKKSADDNTIWFRFGKKIWKLASKLGYDNKIYTQSTKDWMKRLKH